MFERLSKISFKIVLEKYEFHREEVKFLGFIIRRNRVRMDLDKIKSV